MSETIQLLDKYSKMIEKTPRKYYEDDTISDEASWVWDIIFLLEAERSKYK